MNKKILILLACLFLILTALGAFFITHWSNGSYEEDLLTSIVKRMDERTASEYSEGMVGQMRQICQEQNSKYFDITHASLCTDLGLGRSNECTVVFNALPIDMAIVNENFYKTFPQYDPRVYSGGMGGEEVLKRFDEGRTFFKNFTESCLCNLPSQQMDTLTSEREEGELYCRTADPE